LIQKGSKTEIGMIGKEDFEKLKKKLKDLLDV